jgi:hypothetical protein
VKAHPSSFGFAVAVHPREADTAWFVPAIQDEKRIPVEGRLVVTRTRDGGQSSGDRLLFGSTTGNLWISEDQGDSWQGLASSLPPIYCVRFA